MKKLKSKTDKAIEDVIKAFEEKQEMDFEYFIADNPMGVACFGDVLHCNMDDIYFDLFSNQPKGQIVDWCYDQLESDRHINYRSYAMGFRNNETNKT